MPVYDRQTAMALRLIKAKGQLVVWRKETATTPDPALPWKKVAGTPTDANVSIAFITGSDFLRLLAGSNAAQGGQKALMGRTAFVPDVSDVVIRNGVTYAIQEITPIAPNGEVILYKIEFKK